MELVLSPGRLGGGGNGPGSPFQNQEVREWSHVDRLTGMLEHARIETGRWQTRNQGTAQAYGKVIDSRERNSADGNVVQKARRQVEVFQSQGIGGRSVQVVRASQWSSSRITDSTSSSPVSVSMSDASQLRNGNDDSLQLAKLSQVSRLCRQINAEAALANDNNKRTNYRDKIAPQSSALVNRLKKFESSSSVTKSTSNEDLTKSAGPGANSQTVFTRDCKARRSLQIPKRVEAPETRRLSPEGTEFDDRNGSSDRKMVKSYVLGMEEAPKNITDKKFLFNGADENGEYLRPTPIVLRPKSNKTVVHLNNKLFAEPRISSGSENESVSSQDTDSLVKSRVQSLASQFSQSNNYHSHMQINSSSFVAKKQVVLDSTRIESLSNNSAEMLSTDDSQSQFSGKPVKKVGFCKTEVHFAAESGKVNIVETDCKPPPSNRFRRRRRSNPVSMNTPSSGMQANKNLPLIHFGDTTYEKYIFGQSIKDKTTIESEASDQKDDKNDVQQRLQNSSGAEDFVFRDGWGARIKTILQSEPLPIVSKEVQPNELVNGMSNFDGVIQDETIAVDHTFRGSHTTTVNLGADLISKLQKHTNEGKCNTISTGIQLQFKTRLQKLTPINSSPEIKTPEKTSPTKNTIIVTKSPAPCSIVVSTVSKIPRPLIQTQQSVLKSAHLVMNLNRINGLKDPKTEKNPLSLKHLLSSLRDKSLDDEYRDRSGTTLIKINEKHSSQTNVKSYPALFTPLELKHLNDRLNEYEERRRIEEVKDQLQYSSGSEQADEEVRSYMLGSKTREKTIEERVGSKTVDDDDGSIDKMVDHELDILNSGLPEEEICFESNRTVEKNTANENNVVTSDNENNKVLFNIVTTHEPVIARVEDTRPPEVRRELFGGKKDKSDKYPSVNAKKTSIRQKAKDHCDNMSAGKDDDAKNSIDPTYVNVFEGSVREAESIPIYENFRVAPDTKYRKSNHVNKVIKSLAELNSVTDAIVKSATNGNCESDTSSLSNTDCEEDAFKRSYSKDLKLATISENRLAMSARNIRESQKAKPSRTRSKKTVVRSPSSTSSIESIHRTSANEGAKDSDKPLHAKSTRSSRLHRATNGHESSSKETIERYSSNEKKKKTTIDKPRVNHAVDPTAATGTKKSLNDSTKSKKPIEIVYQTAVFNMKNEKLAGKSSRSKESKAPRYINDLICGSSKPKRSTDVRHARGSALSQQRVHHKSASPTNRHWK